MKQAKDTLAGRIIELELYGLSLKEKLKEPQSNCVNSLFNHAFESKRISYILAQINQNDLGSRTKPTFSPVPSRQSK